VLEDVFSFHPLSIEDCVMASPSPKVEEYAPRKRPVHGVPVHGDPRGGLQPQGRVFATSELNFFLGKNFLVTYHDVPLRSVPRRGQAIKSTVHIARAPDRVAYTLLDSIVDNYKPALDELSLEIAELEQQAFSIRPRRR